MPPHSEFCRKVTLLFEPLPTAKPDSTQRWREDGHMTGEWATHRGEAQACFKWRSEGVCQGRAAASPWACWPSSVVCSCSSYHVAGMKVLTSAAEMEKPPLWHLPLCFGPPMPSGGVGRLLWRRRWQATRAKIAGVTQSRSGSFGVEEESWRRCRFYPQTNVAKRRLWRVLNLFRACAFCWGVEVKRSRKPWMCKLGTKHFPPSGDRCQSNESGINSSWE